MMTYDEFAYHLENHSGNHVEMTYSEMVKFFKEYNEAHGFTCLPTERV